jgi:hypothetical protein
MNNLAQARTKAESMLSVNVVLPTVLIANTCALFALDHLGGIPNWLKSAAALFLAF